MTALPAKPIEALGDADTLKDVPYRLKDIVALAYPNGGMTLSGLRREIAKGNLVAELTAGKHFVTLRAIEEMRRKCRALKKAPVSGSARSAATAPVAASPPANGSLSTEPNRSAQDALRARKLMQIANSRNTTSPNTARRAANAT